MIYSILSYGNPILKKPTKDIDEKYNDLFNIIDNMWETMYNAKGVGLAAPQIGISISLFLVDGTPFIEDENINVEDYDRHMRTAASYLSTNISVHDMLFDNSNVRVESSSTIGPLADKVFIYPSVDIAWQFSKLKPLFGSPILTFGKLRIAYGEVGVEPPPFNTQSIYVSPNYSDSFGVGQNWAE